MRYGEEIGFVFGKSDFFLKNPIFRSKSRKNMFFLPFKGKFSRKSDFLRNFAECGSYDDHMGDLGRKLGLFSENGSFSAEFPL